MLYSKVFDRNTYALVERQTWGSKSVTYPPLAGSHDENIAPILTAPANQLRSESDQSYAPQGFEVPARTEILAGGPQNIFTLA
ncbi:hypothetical protein SCLCIDRAFT_1224940 [Scleroderma citrinum Foug A]|uniref:Uncharacterized protein n=1 Tax=Scleroderma citrinum Foug A TaxID=1036808 RepID=A0A0C3D4I4_9AGAM|nr:hypothetical protein SCLCIDRAFT_1224940 [Scleroderma citrinum Foug A]